MTDETADRDEVAQRLERIRRAVNERLGTHEPGVFDPAVRDEVAFHLRPGIGVVVSGDPGLAVTDELQAANECADILASSRSQAPGVGRLIDLVRRFVRPLTRLLLGPELRRQQQFNAHTARHLNELGNRLEQRVRHLEQALVEWSSNPGGIDGRLRKCLEEYDAALRQRHMTLFSALEEEVLAARGAAARIDALEAWFVERAQAVDRRFDEKDEAMAARMREMRALRGRAAAVDRMEGQIAEVMALRSMLQKALEAATPASSAAPRPAGEPTTWSELGDWMGDQDYRSFQDRFRGNPEAIAARMGDHVARFASASGVVADLGCGRGEFLDLLAQAGIPAMGVEINAADVDECRGRGHDAEVGDLFHWLASRDEASLGGIFMAQVIEHLPPGDWQRFVELAATRLAPGGVLVVETINPGSLYAMARAYVVDPTHIRPVHPELLAFLTRRAGFHPVDIHYQSPVPDNERPAGLPFFSAPDADLSEDLAAIKESLARIDLICCAPQEYTLEALRPGSGNAG